MYAYVKHERALMWKEGPAEGPEKGGRVNRSIVQRQICRKMPETYFVFLLKLHLKWLNFHNMKILRQPPHISTQSALS